MFNRRKLFHRGAQLAAAGIVVQALPIGNVAAAIPETTHAEPFRIAPGVDVLDTPTPAFWARMVRSITDHYPDVDVSVNERGHIIVDAPAGMLSFYATADESLLLTMLRPGIERECILSGLAGSLSTIMMGLERR